MKGLIKYLLVAILAIALVASTGMAYAKLAPQPDGLTVNVDTIQTNGVYHGIPVPNSSGSGQVTYDYQLVPDGTYTVMGTVINDNKTVTYNVTIWALPSMLEPDATGVIYLPQFTRLVVSNGTSARFSIRLSAPSDMNITVIALAEANGRGYLIEPGTGSVDYILAADGMTHTIDQGPMSNQVALYSNGRFTFNNSTLYSFAI